MNDKHKQEMMAQLASALTQRHGEREPSPPRPLPEAEIMELRAAYERYRECRFSPGQIVVSRDDSIYDGTGTPCVVLEVSTHPHYVRDEEEGPSSPDYGQRLDMRIGRQVWTGERWRTLTYWVESWMFDPWSNETEVGDPMAGEPR